MQESELEAFRVRFRLEVVERLVLYHALTEPVLNGHLAMQASRDLLVGWLRDNAAVVGKLIGARLQEPAMTALFSDEVEEMTQDMIVLVDKIAASSPT